MGHFPSFAIFHISLAIGRHGHKKNEGLVRCWSGPPWKKKIFPPGSGRRLPCSPSPCDCGCRPQVGAPATPNAFGYRPAKLRKLQRRSGSFAGADLQRGTDLL